MGDDQIDWERLDRFVRGEGSPADRAALERWVDEDPTRRALADAMRSAGAPRSGDAPRFDAVRALRRVQRQSAPRRPTNRMRLTLSPESRRTGSRRRVMVVMGIAAVVIGGALTWRTVPRQRPTDPPREIITAAGQRATLDLGDGTRVSISPGTRLRYPVDFGRAGARRQVWLDGEAAFRVQHDSARALVVHTPYGMAEDLGTEFAVNTYPEVRGMQLAVREGRVAIRAAPDSARRSPGRGRVADTLAILEPGDVARLSETGTLDVMRRQDVATMFAGAAGELVLQSTVLRDAIPLLERWYAIRIHVSDRTMSSRRISGTFRAESATEAVGVIAIALDCKAMWKDNEVTLVAAHERGDDQ
jgi:ferric-dicitrate binding protein FerR (iron transport regulator)